MGLAVTIADLGLGNLRSVARAFERAEAEVTVVSAPDGLKQADRLVVPGQGGFAAGAAAIRGGVGEALRAHLETERPLLGICLGMQLLLEGSDEAPEDAGLGVVRGRVERIDGGELKVPHMGWNRVGSEHPVIGEGHYYFVHSYHCAVADPAWETASVDYGGPLVAAMARGNAVACQFHPEKSHRAGAGLIRRFLAL
ncbi:MAG: imidazole glycerol phosphate synthase subunit HisH [Myxococcota bacterium]